MAGSEGGVEAVVYKKGAWSKEEDEKLRKAVEEQGIRNWVKIEKISGLGRPAKNCRLRWLNYLRPNLKKHPFSEEEEQLILDLHAKYGNSWARIASKLPGRSDNEIKNFWHKRAKKCKREKLPIHTTTLSQENVQKQSHTNAMNDNHSTIDESSNHDHHTSQFQPSTPNIVTIASDALSIHSPQSMISTPQPQFLSSPTTLFTSSPHQLTPSNHLPHQTTLYPNTPTSQIHNSFLSSSPHQTTQTNLNTPDHLQPSSLFQGGDAFTFLRKPTPIHSSPLRRFLRATSQSSPAPGVLSIPGSPHLDSSQQIQWSPAMESPRSPLKLKLSPGFPPQYTVQMSTETPDSSVGSRSGFLLNSPTTPPLSPLKLRLAVPVPSESSFQSNLLTPESGVQLNRVPPSCPQLDPSQPMTVDTDHTVSLDSSLAVKGEPSSIQNPPPETSGMNSCRKDVESESDLEMLDELRKAQARVRFLKRRLKQSSRKQNLSNECPEETDVSRREVPPDENSSQSTIKDCALSRTSSGSEDLTGGNLVNAPPKNSRKRDMAKRNIRRKGVADGISSPEGLQVKKVRKGHKENLDSGMSLQGSIELEKTTRTESSGSKISSEKNLQQEDSMSEFLKRINSKNLHEPTHSMELLDSPHIASQSRDDTRTLQDIADKCSNVCPSVEGFLNESSSTLLQDGYFNGDFFGQTSLIENPVMDAFGPVYSQSSATLVKPGDESGQLTSYLQPDVGFSFRRERTDDSQRGFSGHGLIDCCQPDLLMHQNTASTDLLDLGFLGCEQFFLQNSGGPSSESRPAYMQHQYHTDDLLNSNHQTFKQLMEQEPLGATQFCLRPDGCGNSSDASKIHDPAFLQHQIPETSLLDSRHLMGFENEMEGLLADDLWTQGQVVSNDQTFSANRLDTVMESMMNWNNESSSGYTGGYL